MGVDRSTGWRLATLARARRLAAPRSRQRPIPPGDAAVRAGHPRPRHHRRPRRGPARHDRARGVDRRERRPGDPRRRQRGLHRQDRRHRGGPRVHPQRPAGLAARDRRRQGLPRPSARRGARAPTWTGHSTPTPPRRSPIRTSSPGSSTRRAGGAGRSTAASSSSRRAPSPCPCSTRWAGASRRWASTSRSRGSTTTTRRRMVEQLRARDDAPGPGRRHRDPGAAATPGGAARDGALTDRRRRGPSSVTPRIVPAGEHRAEPVHRRPVGRVRRRHLRPVVNPSDGTVVTEVDVATDAQVQAAIAAARRAFDDDRLAADADRAIAPRCSTASPTCSTATRRRWPPRRP